MMKSVSTAVTSVPWAGIFAGVTLNVQHTVSRRRAEPLEIGETVSDFLRHLEEQPVEGFSLVGAPRQFHRDLFRLPDGSLTFNLAFEPSQLKWTTAGNMDKLNEEMATRISAFFTGMPEIDSVSVSTTYVPNDLFERTDDTSKLEVPNRYLVAINICGLLERVRD